MAKSPDRTYFIQSGKALQKLADAGNTGAKEELERRAKRRKKKKKKSSV
jgi:hypothetical protein